MRTVQRHPLDGQPLSGGYLAWVQLKDVTRELPARYPFSLPVVAQLRERLPLDPKITFFVGENGSGKSTLIEALAVNLGFNPEGGTQNFNFSTRSSESELHRELRVAKNARRPRTGFFLRAESYFNVATNIEALDREPSGGPPIIESYGGVSLHEQSHGESFMALVRHRFGAQGLYILDEPEAALSPRRQLELLQRIHRLILDGSQFVIATHSPMLMAYPGALIYTLSQRGIMRTSYRETDHYRLTRQFLESPEATLAEALSDEPHA